MVIRLGVDLIGFGKKGSCCRRLCRNNEAGGAKYSDCKDFSLRRDFGESLTCHPVWVVHGGITISIQRRRKYELSHAESFRKTMVLIGEHVE